MLTFGGQVLRRAYRLRSALRRDLRVTTCPSGSCDTHAWDKLPKIGASSLASPRSAGIVRAGTIIIGAFGARVDFARPKKRHPLDPPASDVWAAIRLSTYGAVPGRSRRSLRPQCTIAARTEQIARDLGVCVPWRQSRPPPLWRASGFLDLNLLLLLRHLRRLW